MNKLALSFILVVSLTGLVITKVTGEMKYLLWSLVITVIWAVIIQTHSFFKNSTGIVRDFYSLLKAPTRWNSIDYKEKIAFGVLCIFFIAIACAITI